jgi:hypothetical protein
VSRPGRPGTAATFFFGGAVAFVAGVQLVRAIRPALLLDPDPSWAVARLLLWLGVLAGTSSAGGLAAGLFSIWLRSRFFPEVLRPLELRRPTIVLLAAAALVLGTFLRFIALERLPPSMWIDDLSLIPAALDLTGTLSDFGDSVRPAPYGVLKPYGSVGVLYLELFRESLRAFGTTVFGVRFLSAAAGVLSLGTAMLVARALLPAGGGALAALVLAGLRWNLLMSRWGWNAIVLAPLADVAALLVIESRRRKSLPLGIAAGLVAGLCAHIYLAAWVVAAALFAFAVWPEEARGTARFRLRLALVFVAGFAVAASPLFLLRKPGGSPYFARASDHNLLREVHYLRSPLPAFLAAADSLAAPWFKSDPFDHHDLPGRTRLGWILGLPVAVALSRALVSPREPFSAFLLCHAAAAFCASVAGGHAGIPNGYRFAYLSNVTAVAASGGILALLKLAPPARRRAAVLAAVGLVAISGALGARDALLRWPERPETFGGFFGHDTLLGRAVARWERYGTVSVDPGVGHAQITLETVRRYRLDPDDAKLGPRGAGAATARREFRVVPPGAPAPAGERRVERVSDAWGREWGSIYGGRRPSAAPGY